ncbi:MAG: hypothetical protein ABI995_10880 [Acidobacteriota bacterium]
MRLTPLQPKFSQISVGLSLIAMLLTIDGKQYISVAAGPVAAGTPAPPPQPAHLFVLTIDGKAPLPGAPAN